MVIKEDKESKAMAKIKQIYPTTDLPKLKIKGSTRNRKHANTSLSGTIEPSGGSGINQITEPHSAISNLSGFSKKNVTPSRIQKALHGIRQDIYNKDYLDN